MALSRKYLQGMGLTEEQVTAIIEANEDTINGLKDEIEQHKSASEEANKKLTKVQKELDTIKEEAEKNEGKNPYKVKYDALKEEYNAYKADVNAKETKSKKADSYRKLLKESGVADKRLDAILRVTDVDKLEFDEEGNLKDKDELVKSIKEEWSDFIQTEQKQGANTATPPANNGGGKKTKEEIMAIEDTATRQKAMMENKELFI